MSKYKVERIGCVRGLAMKLSLVCAVMVCIGFFLVDSEPLGEVQRATNQVYADDEVRGDRYSPLVVVVEFGSRDTVSELLDDVHRHYGDDIALVERHYSVGIFNYPIPWAPFQHTVYVQGQVLDPEITLEDLKRVIDSEMTELEARKGGEKTHTHADIKIYINREQLDLSADKYQSTVERPLHPDIHLHDGNGEMIHLHWTGVRIDRFFSSLGMYLDEECLLLEDGREYCTGSEGTLSIYADDARVGPDYLIEDLNRLLVSFGDLNDIPVQLEAVKDEACIYSLQCPERGSPPAETCPGDTACGS